MADGGFTLAHGPVIYGPDNKPIAKQIDIAGVGTEYLIPVGGRRRDTAATQVGSDGDWTHPIFDANGRMHVSPSIDTSTSLAANTATHTTVASQLNAGASQPCSELVVQADPDNTVDVFIGNAALQTIQLTPGVPIGIPINDVNKVWARAASATAVVNWLSRS